MHNMFVDFHDGQGKTEIDSVSFSPGKLETGTQTRKRKIPTLLTPVFEMPTRSS